VRRKSIGGAHGRNPKSGSGKKKKKKDPLGEDDDDDDDDDDVIMVSAGAGAGWGSKNKVRIILPEFEIEGDLDTGMPSRSGLRVRLSKWKPNNVGVQYAQELESATDGDRKWAAVPPLSSPTLATSKSSKSPAGATGKSNAASAAAAAAAASGASAAASSGASTSLVPKQPFNATMPAFLFQKTGPTRTQVIAAAALNLGTREYLAMTPSEVAAATVKANAAAVAAAVLTAPIGVSSTAGFNSGLAVVEPAAEVVPPGTSLLKLALRDYERELTRRVASWLLTRKTTHADAVAPVLAIAPVVVPLMLSALLY
jgi:hypothetical protein